MRTAVTRGDTRRQYQHRLRLHLTHHILQARDAAGLKTWDAEATVRGFRISIVVGAVDEAAAAAVETEEAAEEVALAEPNILTRVLAAVAEAEEAWVLLAAVREADTRRRRRRASQTRTICRTATRTITTSSSALPRSPNLRRESCRKSRKCCPRGAATHVPVSWFGPGTPALVDHGTRLLGHFADPPFSYHASVAHLAECAPLWPSRWTRQSKSLHISRNEKKHFQPCQTCRKR